MKYAPTLFLSLSLSLYTHTHTHTHTHKRTRTHAHTHTHEEDKTQRQRASAHLVLSSPKPVIVFQLSLLKSERSKAPRQETQIRELHAQIHSKAREFDSTKQARDHALSDCEQLKSQVLPVCTCVNRDECWRQRMLAGMISSQHILRMAGPFFLNPG